MELKKLPANWISKFEIPKTDFYGSPARFIDISIQNTGCKTIKQGFKEGWFNVWGDGRIKHAFNFGQGTDKDFYRFVKDNAGARDAFYEL